MSESLPTVFHALVDKRWVRFTTQDLGPQNVVAERLAAAAHVTVPNLFDGNRLSIKGDVFHIGIRLRTLRLQTEFAANPEGNLLLPVFGRATGETLRLSPVFTIPNEAKLMLGIHAKRIGDRWHWTGTHCCVFLEGRSFYPPLPNIYNDSRVCMGSGYEEADDNLLGLYRKVQTRFENSSWNADLFETGRRPLANALFRCDMHGEPLPLPTLTPAHLLPVSHPNLEYYV